MNYLTNQAGEALSGRQPLPVQGMAASTIETASETLTYNGKAVVGTLSVNALNSHPILTLEGDRVGSYWADPENLVYTAKTIDSLTETAASAAVVITDPSIDLEKAFETAAGSALVKRYVIRVTDKSGGVLYGWIAGIAKATNAFTFTIYNHRLSESSQSWVGTLADFDLTLGAKAEIFKYTSSIAFATGTTFTEEVQHPKEFSSNKGSLIKGALENLSSGQFFVDYTRGELIGKRADTTASETVSYKIASSETSAISISNTSINGPSEPVVDSYATLAINLTTGANQVLVSSAANKQIWVYGYALTCGDADGQTVSLQDEDDTAKTGIMEFSQYGGISVPPSGNFAMPVFKLATDKDLEIDITGGDVDGWLSYAIISV